MKVFFGTPHRASSALPWDFTLLNLVCNQFSGILGQRRSHIVRELAQFHETLAEDFKKICGRFLIFNFYQGKSELALYEVVSRPLPQSTCGVISLRPISAY